MSASPSASRWSHRRGAALTLLVSASLAGATVLTGTSGARADTSTPTTTSGTVVTTTPSAPLTTSGPPEITTTRPPTTTTVPCVTLTYISYAPGQTVSNWTFEDGTVPYGVNANGGATLSVDPAAARSGRFGLKVSGLTATSQLLLNIPSYSVGTYQLTAWIRTAPGEPSVPVILKLSDRSVYATPSSYSFSSLGGYFIPQTSVLNGCGGPVTIGKAFTATLQAAQIACGTQPNSTLYLDDISVVYKGTSTVPPPVATMAGGCQPPTTTTTTSPPTTTTTTTTTTTGASGLSCKAHYALQSQWQGGWQAGLTVTNTGTQPFNDWVLEWSFPNGVTVSQLWPAPYTQSGGKVTVRAPSWQSTLPPGGSFTVGYLGSGTPTPPSDVRLNGVSCSAA